MFKWLFGISKKEWKESEVHKESCYFTDDKDGIKKAKYDIVDNGNIFKPKVSIKVNPDWTQYVIRKTIDEKADEIEEVVRMSREHMKRDRCECQCCNCENRKR